jgi:hypothetical protein
MDAASSTDLPIYPNASTDYNIQDSVWSASPLDQDAAAIGDRQGELCESFPYQASLFTRLYPSLTFACHHGRRQLAR